MIFVDGPLRGDVRDVSGPTFVVPVASPNFRFAEAPWEPPFESTFRQVFYHVHPIAMFGRVIHVASVRDGYPTDPDLFEALASTTAKDAVRF